MTDRLTVPDVLPLVLDYYVEHPVGGNLHIVLDDGNVSDDDVRFCLAQAESDQDEPGVQLAGLLLRMSRTQRMKLYHSPKLIER